MSDRSTSSTNLSWLPNFLRPKTTAERFELPERLGNYIDHICDDGTSPSSKLLDAHTLGDAIRENPSYSKNVALALWRNGLGGDFNMGDDTPIESGIVAVCLQEGLLDGIVATYPVDILLRSLCHDDAISEDHRLAAWGVSLRFAVKDPENLAWQAMRRVESFGNPIELVFQNIPWNYDDSTARQGWHIVMDILPEMRDRFTASMLSELFDTIEDPVCEAIISETFEHLSAHLSDENLKYCLIAYITRPETFPKNSRVDALANEKVKLSIPEIRSHGERANQIGIAQCRLAITNKQSGVLPLLFTGDEEDDTLLKNIFADNFEIDVDWLKGELPRNERQLVRLLNLIDQDEFREAAVGILSDILDGNGALQLIVVLNSLQYDEDKIELLKKLELIDKNAEDFALVL